MLLNHQSPLFNILRKRNTFKHLDGHRSSSWSKIHIIQQRVSTKEVTHFVVTRCWMYLLLSTHAAITAGAKAKQLREATQSCRVCSVCLSVIPHGRARLLKERCALNFVVGNFIKVCWHFRGFVKLYNITHVCQD